MVQLPRGHRLLPCCHRELRFPGRVPFRQLPRKLGEKTHRFAAETAATREERPEKIAIGEVWMWERRLWWAVPMEQS
eukprot:s2517_g2.t1